MKKVLTKLKSNSKKLVAVFAVIATVLGIAGYVSVNAGSAPEHHKRISDNGNGTYKISLDVTGEADTTSTDAKANILIVYDVSGSMNDDNSYVYEKNDTGRYGKVGRNYVQLYTRSGSGWNVSYNKINNDTTTGTVYYKGSGWNDYPEYTGANRYVKTNKKRSQVTEKIMYDFADALFKNNKTADSTNVQMALITFSGPTKYGNSGTVNDAKIKKTSDNKIWTSDKNTFLSYFSSTGNANDLQQSYGGGTDWDAAFRRVKEVLQSNETDSDPTYVIFVTDGGPTSRVGGGTGGDIEYANYNAATTNARFAQTYNTDHTTTDKSNTEVYGIYAYGTQGDYLDDLIYFAQNGSHRTGMNLDTVATPKYYDASDTTSLNQAINDIFEAIVKTLGVGNATITDGTTTNVKATTGNMNYKLLSVDTESYEYWLTMDVTGSNGTYTMERVNLATAKPYTITITKKDSSCQAELCEYNVTWEGHEEPVTVLGSVQTGKFKYKWTESNDLYKYNPPAATLNDNGEVIWDLKPLDRLLNGVTYTVTFDVWPSQYTLDLVADIRNGLKDYSTLDQSIKDYLDCDNGTPKQCKLYTNTEAKLTYDDTRDNTSGNTLYTDRLDPVATHASEMEIEKLWDNIFGDYSASEYAENGVTFKVLRGNDKETYDTITLKPDSNGKWIKKENISAGVIQTKNGKALIRESGYDYTFAETPGELDYHWDLIVETVRPMIIDGRLTTLVKVEENAPTIGETNFLVDEATNTTYYKIGDSVYYVRETDSAKLKATNVRRSNLNITKEVLGEGPEDSEFTFELTVNDYNQNNLWFSIYDPKNGTVKDDSFVTIDNEIENLIEKEKDKDGNFNGFYSVKSGTKLTVRLKKDWNLRFTNLPIESTYTFEETNMPNNFVYDATTGTTATIQTAVLPVGAVSNGNGTYTYTKTDGTKVTYTEVKNSKNEVIGYKYDADVTREASQVSEKISGTIYTGNTAYTVKYTNEYELTNIKVNKTWDDEDNQDGKRPTGEDGITLKLYQNGTELTEKRTTITEANAVVKADGTKDLNNWTYTFTELPKFNPNDNNKEYEYTVVEEAVAEYETTYDDSVSVELIAKPADENEEIEVTLLANGEAKEVITLNKDNKFKTTIENLDYLDDNNKMITYTVSTESDTPIKLYTKDKTIEITNEHTPELIDIPVEKVWDDADDQDGVRPNSVTFNLLADGTAVANKTVELTAANATTLNEDGSINNNVWTNTTAFTGLPKYKDGSEIVYTITEDDFEAGTEEDKKNYTSTQSDRTDEETGVKTLIITNAHKPETTTVEGTKTWNHMGNTRIAPDSITVRIYADGTELKDLAKTVTESDNWSYKFENLPKYKNGGIEIVYTIDEDTVPGYIKEKSGYNLKNTLDVVNIPVKKVWDDADNQDGTRPDSVTFNLLANGKEVAEYTLTAKDVAGNTNTWAYTFPNQNKFDSEGKEITYTISEDPIAEDKAYTPSGPTAEKDETTGVVTQVITNKHTPETTVVEGTKTWNHMGNTRIAPETVTIHLFADGVELTDKALTISSSNAIKNEDGSTNNNVWSYKFEGLPKYKNGGTRIIYTIDETNVPGYIKTPNGNDLTNTLEVVNIPVEKVWDDADDQDGIRPDEVTFNLLANGTKVDEYTLTANDKVDDNTWTYTFPNQNKFDSEGNEITYTISEVDFEEVENEEDRQYTVTSSNKTDAEGNKILVITNTHTPETIVVEGTKTWNHMGNTRIAPDSITVRIYADGTELKDLAKTVTESDNWSYKFENLPKYKNGGTEIEYTIDEDEVPGYIKEKSGFNLKNTLEVVNIPVEKVWDDADNQDGARPASVTFNLLANGKEVDEYTLTANDKVAGNDNTWTYTFPNQNKFDSEGKEIAYTISEDPIAEEKKYVAMPSTRTDEEGNKILVITNTRATETTVVEGTKTWNHMGNTRIAPESITVRIYADGVELTALAKTVTADDNWSYKFENLPKYKNGGTKIVYTIDEDKVPGYNKEISGYNITNTLDVVNIPVEKIWDDANNQDGTRPDEVTFNLLANSTKVDEHTLTAEDKVADNANKWAYTFPNQNKYDSEGNEITYTITEEAIDATKGYKQPAYAERTDGDTTIHMVTNKHVPGETEVEITKVWDDASDQDGVRPESITVHLFADGTEITEKVSELTKANAKVNEDGTKDTNTWVYTISGLPKYNNGKEIVYTITEDDFEADVAAENKKYTSKVEGFTITNSHTPEVTSVTVTKVWDDASNQDGKRPASITINLLADGAQVDSKPVTGTGDEWSYTFGSLPKYRDGGTEIVYTITENAIEADRKYTSKVEGYKVTNKHIPETTEVVGKKVWKDEDNLEGYRPATVTVHIFADGVELKDKVLTVSKETAIKNEDGTINNNEWAYSFTDLPKYRNGGKEIVYTVSEDQVPNYDEPAYDDENPYIIINTHQTKELEVVVNKIWNETSAEGIVDEFGHTNEIEVRLEGKVDDEEFYNQTETISPVTNEETGEKVWTYTFKNLPKYRNGQEVVYTAYEVTNVNEYSIDVEFNHETNIVTITNDYTPGKTDISGEKFWDDADNQDGLRPKSITVVLLANGEEFKTVEVKPTKVTNEDGEEVEKWLYEFTNLPAKHDGKDIEYTLAEVTVDGYETITDGYNITNTHTPETVSFTVNKIWNDNNNNDGLRPASITVNLLADGAIVDHRDVTPVMVTNEDGEEVEEWNCEFKDLPKYRDGGTPIVYSVTEENVKSYSLTNVTFDEDTNEYQITNTHEDETIEIEITKEWDDVNDAAMLRPEEIEVDITVDGVVIDTITINAADDNWYKKITGLPKYTNGEEIVYDIVEHAITEYETSYAGSYKDGFVITNKHELGKGNGEDPEELPPQTSVDVEPISNTNNKSFVYIILILLNILGINVAFVKNN